MIEGGPPKSHPRKSDMVSEKMPSQEEFSKYNSFMRYVHTYIYIYYCFGGCTYPPQSTLLLESPDHDILGPRMLSLVLHERERNHVLQRLCIQFMIREVEGGWTWGGHHSVQDRKTCKALKRLTMLARVVGLIPGGGKPGKNAEATKSKLIWIN